MLKILTGVVLILTQNIHQPCVIFLVYHMMFKLSLIPLLFLPFICNIMGKPHLQVCKLKRASKLQRPLGICIIYIFTSIAKILLWLHHQIFYTLLHTFFS